LNQKGDEPDPRVQTRSPENSKILTTASSDRINKTSSGPGNSFALSLLLKWLHRVYQAWVVRSILLQ